MYELLFSDTALRQLKKLERAVQERIIAAIERIKIRPEDFVRRLVGEPYYRLRIGDYRAIVGIKGRELIILVVYVGHRKQIYKNF